MTNRQRFDNLTPASYLHKVQSCLFHFTQFLYFLNLLYFQFSKVFYRRNLFTLIRRVQRLKLGIRIQWSLVWSFYQVFPLLGLVTRRSLLSFKVNIFCWWKLRWNNLLGLLIIFVRLRNIFEFILSHRTLVLFLQVVFSDGSINFLFHLFSRLDWTFFEILDFQSPIFEVGTLKRITYSIAETRQRNINFLQLKILLPFW